MTDSFKQTAWLAWTLSKRQYQQSFKGSFLGPLLPFMYNLAMLSLYSLVFSVILQVKWQQAGVSGNATDIPFWLVLFSGQVMYFCLSENLAKAPTLVLAVPNYVKKIIFPLHILPFINLSVSLFTLAINLLLLLAATIFFVGFNPAFMYIPFLILQLCCWSLGAGWLLGALGVFIRDLQQLVPVIAQVLFFATPIVYPLSAVPEKFRFILYLNPLTNIVETLRGLLFFNQNPDFLVFGGWTVLSILFAFASFFVFQKMRPSFADVM